MRAPTAAAPSKAIWEGPSVSSSPKTIAPTTIRAIRIATGIRETKREGLFSEAISVVLSLLLSITG